MAERAEGLEVRRTDGARCPWCGRSAGIVWVHGHAQCLGCGINVEPCCGGAPADLGPAPGEGPEGRLDARREAARCGD